MPESTVILGELAEDFTAKVRNGHAPDIESYATQHPELADRIRELFPALMLLEGLAAAPTGATVDDRLAEPTAPLLAGTIFGQYRIEREIARGGMGIVYEAEHLTLHRQVALKILPMAGPQAAKQLERFLREARTAAGLHHTNIVPVFDVGQTRGVPYYAMQYINGESLDRVISSSAQSAKSAFQKHQTQISKKMKQVADIGIQAAAGLAHAHQRGVIHRDIKPSNLLLDDRGVVWITDFGLARRYNDVSLTRTGQLLGTPRYMSPEQAEAASKPLDHRTDIYSLGATLYELLTGRPAFDGPTPQDVVKQIIAREPIRPRQLDPHVPRDLETIVLKAMAKRPEDRYPTAQALADDLQRFANGEPIQARRIGIVGRTWRWAKREPVVAGLAGAVGIALLVGAISTGWFAYDAETRRRDVTRAHDNLLQYVQATAEDMAATLNDSDDAGFKEFLWFVESYKNNPTEQDLPILSSRLANFMRYRLKERFDPSYDWEYFLANHATFGEVQPELEQLRKAMKLTPSEKLPRASRKGPWTYSAGQETLVCLSDGHTWETISLWSQSKDRGLSPQLKLWREQFVKHELADLHYAFYYADESLYCVELSMEVTSRQSATEWTFEMKPIQVTQWSIAPQFSSETDLVLTAQLLASGKHVSGCYVPLTIDEVLAGWNSLRSKYPDVFTVPIDDLLAWHLKDDEESVKQKHRHAALFAANFDCRDRPNDPHPFVARGRLFTVLGEWDKAETNFAKAWQLGGTGWVKSECRRLGRDALNDAKEDKSERQILEAALRKADIAGTYLPPIGRHRWARLFGRHRLGLPLDAADQVTLSWLLCGLPMAG